jgi:hypothetical protein
MEAAGVEREFGVIVNLLMARDFWANAFRRQQLPAAALSTDVLADQLKSTRFMEGYWRRRDGVPAADAIDSSRRLHRTRCGGVLEVAGAVTIGSRRSSHRS